MEIIRGKHSWKSFMGNIRGNHFTPEAIAKGSFTNCNRLLILFYIVETARNKEQLWSQNWPERLLRPRLPLKWATIPRATIPRLRETCDSKANWANRSPELRHLSTKWLKCDCTYFVSQMFDLSDVLMAVILPSIIPFLHSCFQISNNLLLLSYTISQNCAFLTLGRQDLLRKDRFTTIFPLAQGYNIQHGKHWESASAGADFA